MLMLDRITEIRRRRRARQRPCAELTLPSLAFDAISSIRDAGLPWPRRAVADGRLLSRLPDNPGRGMALGVGEAVQRQVRRLSVTTASTFAVFKGKLWSHR
jgi:hypothetical protein